MPDGVEDSGSDDWVSSVSSEDAEGGGAGSPRRHRGGFLRWVLYVVVLALGVLIGLGLYRATTPSEPSADASVLVTPLVANPYSPTSASLLNVETEAQLVTADSVSAAVAKALGTGVSADSLAAQTSARVVAGSQVIAISHDASSEESAREAAKAYADSFLKEREARATAYLTEQEKALDSAIASAEKDLKSAAAAVGKSKPTSAARQLANQNLNVASATLAARTDELSALSSTSTDPGRLISLTSESPVDRPWPWVLGGLLVALLLVLGIHMLSRTPPATAEDDR